MSFFDKVAAWFDVPQAFESKGYINLPAPRTPDQISALVAADFGGFGSDENFRNSVVYACARVIAEGLALPECFVRQTAGNGRKLATKHPLFPLLNAAPNDRQTSYGFREWVGFNLALHGNAYVVLGRSPLDNTITELLPADVGMVSMTVNSARIEQPIQYYLFGQPIDASRIWHLKGPGWLSYQGQSTVAEARRAIGLANANETYGVNVFKNGAQPGALITPATGATIGDEEFDELRTHLRNQVQGVNNAHKLLLLNDDLKYTPMGAPAKDAQWIENRRYQVEEICRYFRVSPAKVFQTLGSQSYNSFEMAHIAHQFDTDLQWQQRFVQSANQALFTPAERASGLIVTLDHRSILNGTTASERMAYWVAGVASGIFTQNEARLGEGYDAVDDPEADKLKQAANIMGVPPITNKSPDETADDQPKKQ